MSSVSMLRKDQAWHTFLLNKDGELVVGSLFVGDRPFLMPEETEVDFTNELYNLVQDWTSKKKSEASSPYMGISFGGTPILFTDMDFDNPIWILFVFHSGSGFDVKFSLSVNKYEDGTVVLPLGSTWLYIERPVCHSFSVHKR